MQDLVGFFGCDFVCLFWVLPPPPQILADYKLPSYYIFIIYFDRI